MRQANMYSEPVTSLVHPAGLPVWFLHVQHLTCECFFTLGRTDTIQFYSDVVILKNACSSNMPLLSEAREPTGYDHAFLAFASAGWHDLVQGQHSRNEYNAIHLI